MKRLAFLFALCASLQAQVKLPPYTREVLPNGAVVYFMQRAGLPLVSFRVLVKGGAESDPAAMPGLSSVTAELLRRGAGQRSAIQFNEEIDSLGGVFAASADTQSTIVEAEFLKKDFDTGIGLVADAVLRPTFPEDEVKKSLTRRADSVRTAKDNPASAIGPYSRSFFFGANHPYGRVPDEGSWARISPKDIVDYHRRLYVGRNLIVIVAGDFDIAAAKARVTASFGAASAGSAYAWMEDRAPARGSAPRVLLVDKPDATQTYFVISQRGAKRNTPDRFALSLVNTLFGGRFTSMLNAALRIDSGLTYGASCQVQMSRLTGAITISTYTKTESTAQAIDMALDRLKRLHEQGLTAEQLKSAKAYLKGTVAPETVQTADQIAQVLGEIELFGLGRDEVDEFFAKVDAVTLQQADEVARRYYQTDNLTFVLLGNAAKVREVAAKYGPSVVERSVKQSGWAGN